MKPMIVRNNGNLVLIRYFGKMERNRHGIDDNPQQAMLIRGLTSNFLCAPLLGFLSFEKRNPKRERDVPYGRHRRQCLIV